jgi:hypothetical protein
VKRRRSGGTLRRSAINPEAMPYLILFAIALMFGMLAMCVLP